MNIARACMVTLLFCTLQIFGSFKDRAISSVSYCERVAACVHQCIEQVECIYTKSPHTRRVSKAAYCWKNLGDLLRETSLEKTQGLAQAVADVVLVLQQEKRWSQEYQQASRQSRRSLQAHIKHERKEVYRVWGKVKNVLQVVQDAACKLEEKDEFALEGMQKEAIKKDDYTVCCKRRYDDSDDVQVSSLASALRRKVTLSGAPE